MMELFFWHGYLLEDFVFKSVNINSPGGLAGACVVTALIAIVFEGTRTLRDWLYLEFLKRRTCHGADKESDRESALVLQDVVRRRKKDVANNDESNGNGNGNGSSASVNKAEFVPGSPVMATGTLSGAPGKSCKRPEFHRGLAHLSCSTVVHMCQVCLGYGLMLAVMTFNVWIFVAVLVGTSVGFFLFDSFNRKIHQLKMNTSRAVGSNK